MKLWIDDCRPAPEGYKWVKTVSEAKGQAFPHNYLDSVGAR